MTSPSVRPVVNAGDHFTTDVPPADLDRRDVSSLGRGLVGSEILRIAADIRALQAGGASICNLTVGDFSPSEFRIPDGLLAGITTALQAGQTNYPPSDGVLELRQEILRLNERSLGLSYPLGSCVVAGGARPIIYATFKALVDPGEAVIYPTPSWNNNHYCWLAQAEGIPLVVGEDTDFLPTAELLAPHVERARLICVNTPLNPTGTVMSETQARDLAQLVVDENRRRARTGRRSLFLMWDQVYWMLTFGAARHVTPVELVPEAAAWTVFVDGISKCFAATGLRVGWTLAPPHVAARMRDHLGHVGAWAPRAEQVATAALLADQDAIDAFLGHMSSEVQARLQALHQGFQAMKRDGLPVDSVPPQGAIYLSVKFSLAGRTHDGADLRTNDQVRRLLLEEAGFGVVPFQAFGLDRDDGWMRLSVGAVSLQAIEEALPRVRRVLEQTA